LFLAEELGYKLTDDMHHYAARRAFSNRNVRSAANTGTSNLEVGRRTFRHRPEEALAQVLFEKLKLPSPDAAGKKTPPSKRAKSKSTAQKAPTAPDASQLVVLRKFAAPLPARVIEHGHIKDPLEPLRGLHPIIEPLLEYRQLEASSARLAPRAVYDRITRGELTMPITKLNLRWKPPQ
jgi:hypothetical protein